SKMLMTRMICAVERTPCASTSMYLGAKPSQSFSPVPASTSATNSSEVFRRSARNSEIFCQPFKIQCHIIRHTSPSVPAPKITGMIPHFQRTMPMKAITHTTMAK
ncbi:MAG: hypothetical protein RL616_2656, partial [Verrucomicrobiota bacterium]